MRKNIFPISTNLLHVSVFCLLSGSKNVEPRYVLEAQKKNDATRNTRTNYWLADDNDNFMWTTIRIKAKMATCILVATFKFSYKRHLGGPLTATNTQVLMKSFNIPCNLEHVLKSLLEFCHTRVNESGTKR